MNPPSSHHHSHPDDATTTAGTANGRVTDPVCGMQVDPATTPHHADHAGVPFHFCSERCRNLDLSRWLKGSYAIPVADDEALAESESVRPERGDD